MRLRHWFFVVLLLCLYVAADSTTCSPKKRCEQGCCNKSGNCGFGPDYCGKSVCQSDCSRKSECNPGFGASWAKNEKCPLNVCCSKHGYCGTTKDFCGSKTVKRPSCEKGGDMERVVGYFEGWARDRPCENFWPEQIPTGLYTHINFAFGRINPDTFVIEASDPRDKLMYQRLMSLKKRDKDLKIFLAIGGWTFNDPGPTANVFSDLAASKLRQRDFFQSVQSFMTHYGFDGLDLDWEYPVDKDRGGREIDYTSFPTFMAELKKGLDTGGKGLTITLPASYWYLQYFDIKKLEPTVDFFNIMSYDLHGAWDQHANWTKPYLNAHTNLTEIESALDLLWRNDIDSSKVVMGLGFYGRAFTTASTTCQEPGCLFSEAANAGMCSLERGILLNSEIENEIKTRKLKPKLYKEEAVKVVSWGRQWVSYDDEETLQMKVDRAEERCLGGVMVWAITHDTKNAKYNTALAGILGRDVVHGSLGDKEEASKQIKVPYEQCRWSNCKEPCPKGWVHVGRIDEDRNTKDELMYDETGCGGDGHHSFCCPPEEDIPKCGWYNHDRGKCQKSTSCPPKMVEIGSNQMYCNNKPDVQTACCETTSKSMKVYATCQWGTYPDCDAKPVCGDKYYYFPMVESGGGSGGLQCNNLKNDLGVDILGTQTRKYCCNTQGQPKFTDCRMYRDEGPMISGQERGVCRSNCPSDRVRVAIDWPFHICSAYEVGGQAWCCKTDYSHDEWEPNEKIAIYSRVMTEWVNNPTCPNPSKIFTKRQLSASTSELAPRADKIVDITPHELLTDILLYVGSKEMLAQKRRIWNEAVEDEYEFIQTTYMSNYIRNNWRLDFQGPAEFARAVLCYPRYWANRIRAFVLGLDDGDTSDKTITLNCTFSYCDADGNCEDFSDSALKRRTEHLFSRHSSHYSHSHHHLHRGLNALEPRVKDTIGVHDPDGEDAHEYEANIPTNPQAKTLNELNSRNPLLKDVFMFASPDDCEANTVTTEAYKVASKWFKVLHVEHVIDKIILITFFEHLLLGVLNSGRTSRYNAIPAVFLERMQDTDLSKMQGLPKLRGSMNEQVGFFINRAFECLGSMRNDQMFTIVDPNINEAKKNVMMFYRVLSKQKVKDLMNKIDPDTLKPKDDERRIADVKKALARLRAGFGVFFYIRHPKTAKKLNTIVSDIRDQFAFAEEVYNTRYPNDKVQLSDFWIEWITDYLKKVTSKFKANVADMIKEIRAEMEGEKGLLMDSTEATLKAMELQTRYLPVIMTDKFPFPQPPPP